MSATTTTAPPAPDRQEAARQAERAATGAARRALVPIARRQLAWWWGTLIVIFVGIAVVRDVVAEDVGSSTWQYASQAPRVMHLIVALTLPTIFLPLFLAHGTTRRAFTRAAATLMAASAVLGAGIIAVGFAVERAVADGRGWALDVDGPRLFTTTDAYGPILLEHALLFAVWAVAGWLIGVAYYRTGWLRGTLLLPVTALPVVLSEYLLTTDAARRLADGPAATGLAVPVWAAAVAVITVVGAVVADRLTRDLEVRSASVWMRTS